MRNRAAPLLLAAGLLMLSACGVAVPDPVPTATPAPVETAWPTAEAILEEQWRAEGEVPNLLRIDVSLPGLRADLPGAAEVNGRIEADYAYFMDRELEAYDTDQMGFGDPDLHIRYEVYRFEGIYEICIRGEESSLGGSGPLLWTHTYCYDYGSGTALEASDLLEKLGYTEQDVVDAFYAKMVEAEDPEDYTYEEIQNWYYIGGEGELYFTVSLYA